MNQQPPMSWYNEETRKKGRIKKLFLTGSTEFLGFIFSLFPDERVKGNSAFAERIFSADRRRLRRYNIHMISGNIDAFIDSFYFLRHL
jgi:hypothetical protein